MKAATTSRSGSGVKSHTGLVRKQLEASCRVKQNFPAELVARVAQFAGRAAATLALAGQTGGKLAALAGLLINVPSRDPQRIQESHITIGPIVCSLVEQICAAGS